MDNLFHQLAGQDQPQSSLQIQQQMAPKNSMYFGLSSTENDEGLKNLIQGQDVRPCFFDKTFGQFRPPYQESDDEILEEHQMREQVVEYFINQNAEELIEECIIFEEPQEALNKAVKKTKKIAKEGKKKRRRGPNKNPNDIEDEVKMEESIEESHQGPIKQKKKREKTHCLNNLAKDIWDKIRREKEITRQDILGPKKKRGQSSEQILNAQRRLYDCFSVMIALGTIKKKDKTNYQQVIPPIKISTNLMMVYNEKKRKLRQISQSRKQWLNKFMFMMAKQKQNKEEQKIKGPFLFMKNCRAIKKNDNQLILQQIDTTKQMKKINETEIFNYLTYMKKIKDRREDIEYYIKKAIGTRSEIMQILPKVPKQYYQQKNKALHQLFKSTLSEILYQQELKTSEMPTKEEHQILERKKLEINRKKIEVKTAELQIRAYIINYYCQMKGVEQGERRQELSRQLRAYFEH